MSEATPPQAGWYPNMGGHRYWDGTQWTGTFRPGTKVIPAALSRTLVEYDSDGLQSTVPRFEVK